MWLWPDYSQTADKGTHLYSQTYTDTVLTDLRTWLYSHSHILGRKRHTFSCTLLIGKVTLKSSMTTPLHSPIDTAVYSNNYHTGMDNLLRIVSNKT